MLWPESGSYPQFIKGFPQIETDLTRRGLGAKLLKGGGTANAHQRGKVPGDARDLQRKVDHGMGADISEQAEA